MRIIFTLLILSVALFTIPSAKAQVQHVGAMANVQFEGKGSGNGNIAGGEVQSVHHLGSIVVKNNLQITRDLKGYLDRYGTAIRLHSRARYYFPVGVDKVYLEGGLNTSHFSIADSAQAKDGYKKWAIAPIAGGGFEIPAGIMDVVIDYHYQFRSQLKSSAYSGGGPTNLDGWTTGHKVGLEGATPVKKDSKWLVLTNAAWGRSTYERNPAFYGQQYAGIKYRFTYFEISIGLGRRY